MEMKIHRRGSQNKLLVLSKHELICFVVLLACLAGLAHSAENEKCPNTPQCICKWSGGKRMADCSNAGNNFILLRMRVHRGGALGSLAPPPPPRIKKVCFLGAVFRFLGGLFGV